MRSTKLVAGVLMLVAATTACAVAQTGAAIPVAERTTVSSAPNDYGAPRVSAPLDVTRFLALPCTVLTSVQLQSLALPLSGKPDTDSAIARSVGPGCFWLNSDIERSTNGVSFTVGNKSGLSDIYRGRAEGKFRGYFEPTTVESYPAVFTDAGDYRGDGTCSMSVGVSDSLAFLVTEQGPIKGLGSCYRAKEVATAVVRTLKGDG